MCVCVCACACACVCVCVCVCDSFVSTLEGGSSCTAFVPVPARNSCLCRDADCLLNALYEGQVVSYYVHQVGEWLKQYITLNGLGPDEFLKYEGSLCNAALCQLEFRPIWPVDY